MPSAWSRLPRGPVPKRFVQGRKTMAPGLANWVADQVRVSA